MNIIKKISDLLLLLFLFCYTISNAQLSIGIKPGIHSDVSIVELDSKDKNKGFLIPRMLTAQRNAIALPVRGLSIFNL